MDQGRHDLVRVVASTPDRIVFGGRMQEAAPGWFRFVGRSAPLDAEHARKAQARLDGGIVEVVIARAFGAPSDLLALGRLFLRMLFWNDRQEALLLEPALLDRVAERLAESSHGTSELRAALDAEQIAFGPASVIYRAEDRSSLGMSNWGQGDGQPAVIPDALWSEVWLTALRMATILPGFSFCGGLDDYTETDPGEPLARAARALDGLVERCRGALIGSSGRNSIALDVCRDFWHDVQEAERTGATEDSAERTMVVSRPRR
jgi:hypothetical protein